MRKTIAVFTLVLGLTGAATLAPVSDAQALRLPNYAQAQNVEAQLESKGKKVTDTVSLVVGIIAILSLIAGAGALMTGNTDMGKRLIIGSVVGLILASAAYSIAQLVV